MGPANRSLFTKAIHDKPELDGCHGMLMGLINQAASVSGIAAPTLIASFILRNQVDIDATPDDQHQLTIGVMYAPIFASFVLLGLMYQYCFVDVPVNTKSKDDSDVDMSENTTLLSKDVSNRASVIRISDTLSVQSEARRRMSVEIMGIPIPVDTKYEKELGDKLEKDKKEWEEITKIYTVEN